jgi:hypothetical protein
MPRPASYLIPAIFLSISLVFTGCKTIYSDTYSPRRNHFVPLPPKPKPQPLEPLLDAEPAPSSDLPPLGLPPPAPSSAPVETPMPADGAAPMTPDAAQPMIPGL